MIGRHQIARAAELETLPIFRSFIEQVCAGLPGMDPDTLYDLKLAVDEACSNIIIHGYAGIDPGSILLFIETHPQEVRITITDFGHSFEPSEPPRPDIEATLEGRPTGGFGLYFIYQTMDEVDYVADACGNSLTLVKQLRPAEESQ